jgi:acyl-CoA thioesterase-2
MTDTPSPEQLVSGLLRLLNVAPAGDDTFTGHSRPGGTGRMFGGQVIAQALVAAERTVGEDRPAHSLHAYFLRGGNEAHGVDLTVLRDLDGGSFANRRVVASQQDKPILTLVASFHRREDGPFHTNPMPAVAQPEDLQDEAELRAQYAHLLPVDKREMMLRLRPIEQRPVEARHWMGAEPGEAKSHTWFRTAARLPDDPRVHRAVLAYASDMSLLGTCTLPHGLSWLIGNVIGVSLDHALWFHDDFRADEWLLYVCDSPWAGRARGFNRGQVFTRDGRHVASVAQEGLIRPIKAGAIKAGTIKAG